MLMKLRRLKWEKLGAESRLKFAHFITIPGTPCTLPGELTTTIHRLSLTHRLRTPFCSLLPATSILHPVCSRPQRVKSALGGPLPTMPRKRSLAEMETSEPDQKKEEPSLLQRIRNMWEFVSVMQYIFTFGKAVKIDEDFDIEVRYSFTACSYTTPRDRCGVYLMNGITKLMDTGL